MFGLRESLEALRDGRPRPRIPASLVVKGFMVMLLARLGSLNGLEQVRPKSWLRRWLGGDVPSADTMGRVAQSLPPEAIRRALRRQYGRRRRNKSLAALPNGLRPVIFDRSVETKCIPRGRTGQFANSPSVPLSYRGGLSLSPPEPLALSYSGRVGSHLPSRCAIFDPREIDRVTEKPPTP